MINNLSFAEEFRLYGQLSLKSQETLIERDRNPESIVRPSATDAYCTDIGDGMYDNFLARLREIKQVSRMPAQAKVLIEELYKAIEEEEYQLVQSAAYQREQLDMVEDSINKFIGA